MRAKKKAKKTSKKTSKKKPRRKLSNRRNYARGADFERYFVKKILTEEGALHAMRSAGSHGVVDVIGLFATPKGGLETRCYQLKTGRRFQINAEDLDFLSWLEEYGAVCRVVYRTDYPAGIGEGPNRWKTFVFSIEETWQKARIIWPTLGDAPKRSVREGTCARQ